MGPTNSTICAPAAANGVSGMFQRSPDTTVESVAEPETVIEPTQEDLSQPEVQPSFFEKYWSTLLPATVGVGAAAYGARKFMNHSKISEKSETPRGIKRSSSKKEVGIDSQQWIVLAVV